ncbi:taurine catabolism dioxygenase TauD, TfdA family-domain-containing protein, partial [Elsinoe ampelina]
IDPIQLRDMCSCELCVDPSSGQKNFWTVDIPANISIAERQNLGKDEGFAFTWENDVPGFPVDHITKLNDADLYYHLFMKTDRRTRTLASCNKAKIEKELVVVDFEAYLNDIVTYKQVLRAVRDNGLAFVTNVPESEDSVVNIAEKIGPLRNSFYGMTWDVKSVPKAENVAYTARHLGFHMDLLYMAEPPKLQFLHCLRSSAEGGASLFSDAYQAIEELYQTGTCSLTELHNHHTVFHYDRNGKKYSQNRPLIGLAVPASRFQGTKLPVTPFLEHVNWSPPFQGPNSFRQLFGHSDQLMKWHTIANQFKQRTEHPDNVYERKMAPGECVIFDNRRMLHARTAFSPGDVGKERWLKGCYVDGDPWESELNVHDI